MTQKRRFRTGGGMIVELFPEAVFELQRELEHHPEITSKLKAENIGTSDWAARLAKVARECNVYLNGDYSEADIEEICRTLISRLRTRRLNLILPSTHPN